MTEHASRVNGQLLEWVQEARRLGINVTRDMIRTQAAVLANKTTPQLLQPVSTTSLPQTATPTSFFNLGSSNTLAPSPDQAYTAGLPLTDHDLDFLTHSCGLTAVQEEELSHTTAGLPMSNLPCATMQDNFLYNTLDHSGLHDPALTLDAIFPSPQTYDKATCQRTICANTHNKFTDAVCLSEARWALEVVERYVSKSPTVTVLDQLCLNHVKACLHRI
jgi:hypothetical protein